MQAIKKVLPHPTRDEFGRNIPLDRLRSDNFEAIILSINLVWLMKVTTFHISAENE